MLLHAKEWERLAASIDRATREDLVGLGYYTAAPIATALERSHPRLAAKLSVAMALRILEAKKSKLYQAAHDHLARAKELMLASGGSGEWQELVLEIRERHARKYSFMPAFEQLAAARSGYERSFVEGARDRASTPIPAPGAGADGCVS